MMLDRSAEKNGDLPFATYAGKSRTFSEVREDADRIANFLASRGIKEGDRIAIFLPNVPHFPAVFFGALKAGAKVVTCNPMYKAGELNYQLFLTIQLSLQHAMKPSRELMLKLLLCVALSHSFLRQWLLLEDW
jgi:acyl-CoA synthetase (AMP-forming)/AMP-acid ligase II